MKSLNVRYFVFDIQNRQSRQRGKRQSGTRGDKKQPTEGGEGVGAEGGTIAASVAPIINSVSARCDCFRVVVAAAAVRDPKYA